MIVCFAFVYVNCMWCCLFVFFSVLTGLNVFVFFVVLLLFVCMCCVVVVGLGMRVCSFLCGLLFC